MPTQPSTAPANATSRRTFLARAAVGGAVASVAATASPLGGWLAPSEAAAQALADDQFAQFVAPLELAAVQVYQAALDGGQLSDAWSDRVLILQGHHQEVADALTELLPDGETATPLAAFAGPGRLGITGAADEDEVLGTLAGVEDTLSATHLLALASITDPTTAKLASQVLASEGQAAAALGTAAGVAVEGLTPSAASTDAAIEPGSLTDEASGGDDTGTDSGSGGTDSGSSGNAGSGSTDSSDGSGGSGDNSGGGDSGGSGSGSDSGGSSSDSGGSGDAGSGSDASTSSGSN